jgi:hypothetical protein
MACGCAKRTMSSMTSANIPESGSMPDRPDIAAAKAEAAARVEAAMAGSTGGDKSAA